MLPSESGHKLDKDHNEEMLREYYRLRDWDESTGVPRAGMAEKEGPDEARG